MTLHLFRPYFAKTLHRCLMLACSFPHSFSMRHGAATRRVVDDNLYSPSNASAFLAGGHVPRGKFSGAFDHWRENEYGPWGQADEHVDAFNYPGGTSQKQGYWDPTDGGWIYHEPNASKEGNFVCPPECAECCDAGRRRNNRFTCTLRNELPLPISDTTILTDSGPLFLPGGRCCSLPEKRGSPFWMGQRSEHNKQDRGCLNHSSKPIKAKKPKFGNIYRVECEYTEAEMMHQRDKSKPDLGKCGERFNCCCSGADFWTERICMPLKTNFPPHVWVRSKSSNRIELYVKTITQTYKNFQRKCVAPYNEDRYFDEPKGLCERRARASGGRGKEVKNLAGCDSSCCLETNKSQSCDEHDNCHDVITCVRFEMLYFCSSDGGATQDGVLYQRRAANPGTCVSEESQRRNIFGLNAPFRGKDTRRHVTRVIPEVQYGRGEPRLRHGNVCPKNTFSIGADSYPCSCKTTLAACRWGVAPDDQKNISKYIGFGVGSTAGSGLGLGLGGTLSGVTNAGIGVMGLAGAAGFLVGGVTAHYAASSLAKSREHHALRGLQESAKLAKGRGGSIWSATPTEQAKSCWVVASLNKLWKVRFHGYEREDLARIRFDNMRKTETRILFGPEGIEDEKVGWNFLEIRKIYHAYRDAENVSCPIVEVTTTVPPTTTVATYEPEPLTDADARGMWLPSENSYD